MYIKLFVYSICSTFQPQYTLKGLLLNSRYTVRIQVLEPSLENAIDHYTPLAQVPLETTKCPEPSDDFLKCLVPIGDEATTMSTDDVMSNDTGAAHDDSLEPREFRFSLNCLYMSLNFYLW